MIVGAQVAVSGQFGPIVDGAVVPRDPFDPDAPSVSADVPLMAGSNLHDSGMNRTDFSIDDAAAQEQIKTTMGADSARIWAAYRGAYPKAAAAQLLARISSDQGIRTNTRTLIERKASLGGAPAFLYLLTWPAPFMGGRYGSVHGTDVPLIFHNPELWPLTAGSPEGRVVADRMAGAFVAFAKNGSPGTPELPWAAYNSNSKPTMLFDVQSGVKNDPDRELLSLLPRAGRGRG
jgi:para-nitrobenzyl esterase